MKNHFFKAKYFSLILCTTIIYHLQANAQDSPVMNYLQQAGDFADIYNGRIEPVYSSIIYENLPYYMTSEFTAAAVVFKNKYYPNQRARLDLFREQLIILPPEKRHGIIVSSQNVERVFIYNKIFVFLNPPKKYGIKDGYYIQLLESEKIKLYCKESYTIRQKQLVSVFDNKTRYYLFYRDQCYTVKNKGSFSKLFPQYKKQINQYAKDHKLNFNQRPDESLIALAGYCEELITSTNK